MSALLLSLAAWALEPPAPADRPPPTPGECVESVPVVRGDVVNCVAVAVPVSEAAHFLLLEADYQKLRQTYRTQTSALQFEIDRVAFEREWMAAELAKQAAPVPFWHRPEVRAVATLSAGVVSGGALTVAASKVIQNATGGE